MGNYSTAYVSKNKIELNVSSHELKPVLELVPDSQYESSEQTESVQASGSGGQLIEEAFASSPLLASSGEIARGLIVE